jgi:uncharacterized OB-fold protein
MPIETEIERSSAEIPIRKNLFSFGPDGAPRLICSRCKECGGTFYPKLEEICPSCIKEGTLEIVEIGGRGRIVAFTQVARPLPGFDMPYVLAYVELDGGPSLVAQLEDWQDADLEINMPVDLVIGRIKQQKDGAIVIGPKFRPVCK